MLTSPNTGNLKLKNVLTSGYFGGDATQVPKRRPAQTLHNINEEDINDRDQGSVRFKQRDDGLINKPYITHNTPSYEPYYKDYAPPQAPLKEGGPLL
jgi:hypothetical protein